MAPHSSTLAWEIPWMEEPGGLRSMGSLRVGHDWVTSLSLLTFMLWKGKWPHSSVLAWIIPGTEEPGGLPSMGSHRVGQDWHDLGAGAVGGGYLTLTWPLERQFRLSSCTGEGGLCPVILRKWEMASLHCMYRGGRFLLKAECDLCPPFLGEVWAGCVAQSHGPATFFLLLPTPVHHSSPPLIFTEHCSRAWRHTQWLSCVIWTPVLLSTNPSGRVGLSTQSLQMLVKRGTLEVEGSHLCHL